MLARPKPNSNLRISRNRPWHWRSLPCANPLALGAGDELLDRTASKACCAAVQIQRMDPGLRSLDLRQHANAPRRHSVTRDRARNDHNVAAPRGRFDEQQRVIRLADDLRLQPVLVEEALDLPAERRARAVLHQPHPVSYTHLRAHETPEHLVCRL